jgi:hypothetical protein
MVYIIFNPISFESAALEDMSLNERWALKRSVRPGVIYRNGNKLGNFLGYYVGKGLNQTVVPVRGTERHKGFLGGMQNSVAKSYVMHNPKTVAAAGILATIGVAGVLNMGYQAVRYASPSKTN